MLSAHLYLRRRVGKFTYARASGFGVAGLELEGPGEGDFFPEEPGEGDPLPADPGDLLPADPGEGDLLPADLRDGDLFPADPLAGEGDLLPDDTGEGDRWREGGDVAFAADCSPRATIPRPPYRFCQ